MEVQTLLIRGETSDPPIKIFLPNTLLYNGNWMLSLEKLLLNVKEPIPRIYNVGLRTNFIRSVSSIFPGSLAEEKSIFHIFHLYKEPREQSTVTVSSQFYLINNVTQTMEIELIDLDDMKPLGLNISVNALFLYKRQ